MVVGKRAIKVNLRQLVHSCVNVATSTLPSGDHRPGREGDLCRAIQYSSRLSIEKKQRTGESDALRSN